MESSKHRDRTGKEPYERSRRDFIQITTTGTAAIAVLGPFMGCSSIPENAATSLCPAPAGPMTKPYAVTEAMVARFKALSEVLTGVKPLPDDLARQYLERMAANPWINTSVKKMIDAFDAAMQQRVLLSEAELRRAFFDDPDIRSAAQQSIYIWYVSAFFLPASAENPTPRWWYGTTDQYERALVWSVMHAHAPMTVGPDWTERPRNI